jgi:hypothetical protein
MDKHDDISGAYRNLEQAEPSDDLDTAIMKAARAELKTAKQASGRLAFWQQWLRPLSAVAVMGVCVTVVLQVVDNAPTLTPGLTTANEASADLTKVAQPQADMAAAPDMPATHKAKRQNEEARKPEPKKQARRADAAVGSVAEKSPMPSREQRGSARLAMNEMSYMDDMTTAKRAPSSALPETSAPAETMEEIAVTARHRELQILEPSATALAAWNNGARPAADVWRAGIEAMRNEIDSATIAAEMARLQRSYPEITLQDATTEQAGSLNDIASSWAWSAGIELLNENDNENSNEARAAAEIDKFLLIYPGK